MVPRSVLLVTRSWARDGGVGAHVMASAAALVAAGVRVSVLATRIDPSQAVTGVRAYPRPRLLDSDAPMDVRLGELPPELDVVHVHHLDDPDIVGALRASAPVLASAHGYPGCTSGVYYFRPGRECTRAHGPGCALNLLARGCAHTSQPQTLPGRYRRTGRELDALGQADLVLAYSSSVDRHLARNGLTRRRVIPLFSTMTPVAGEGHEGRRRVVFAGRLTAPKGVEVLIRAAREVECEFVVCGDGWRLEAARRLARKLGVQERVLFKGWLAGGELARELAEASVVVVPSLWPEPFGLVGIEALAAGRPVVASATGGIADWLDDGVSGLLVAPGDAGALARALNELLADPDRQRKMGVAGRETVARSFTPTSHVRALLDAYGDARARWLSERGEPDGDATPVMARA
jgi:glycosyltransferase involved in cell wall biosynthesis